MIVTANVWAGELPQLLLAVTLTVPPIVPDVDMILLVVELPVHPTGSDHVYEVAPLTVAIENVSGTLLQTAAVPLMAAGVAGVLPMLTARVWAAELPQALLAVTDTVPAVTSDVAVMLSPMEEPVHVPGSDHV